MSDTCSVDDDQASDAAADERVQAMALLSLFGYTVPRPRHEENQ